MKQGLHGLLGQLRQDETTSMESKLPSFITYLCAEFEPQGNDNEVRASHEAKNGHKALIED